MNVAQWTEHELVSSFLWVLNFKIFEVDGNGISVGKVLTGIILLVVGYMFSKRASRAFERRVLAHMPIEESIRYTFRQLVFYFLLFITTLFTLRALNVPITIFTVLGGALAVGIGFGSQNLVNNFISGILVMAERPMRIGDYIDVDGLTGRVESMGIRSTTVRTMKGVLVTMPNTQFIEKNLTNWTMSGTMDCTVSIGVAYGTDVEKLRRVAMEAVAGLAGVVSHPPPGLNFVDFGDSALMFDVAFTISSDHFAQRKAMESQIRYRLYELLAKAEISIPFPVRDVNLSIQSPVPVKVLN